jgi:hypothetical protein
MSAKLPQLVLICCEGNTEKAYFENFKNVFRISSPKIEVITEETSFKGLIKRGAKRRSEYSKEYSIKEEDIEVWVVFDRDNYKENYLKLEQYAENENIKIAFSDPQFENFLIQHFQADSKILKGKAMKDYLLKILVENKMSDGRYDKNWTKKLFDEKPKSVRIAIENCKIYTNHAKKPFFTVHKLVERLLEFKV